MSSRVRSATMTLYVPPINEEDAEHLAGLPTSFTTKGSPSFRGISRAARPEYSVSNRVVKQNETVFETKFICRARYTCVPHLGQKSRKINIEQEIRLRATNHEI